MFFVLHILLRKILIHLTYVLQCIQYSPLILINYYLYSPTPDRVFYFLVTWIEVYSLKYLQKVAMRSIVYIEQKNFSDRNRLNIRNQTQMCMTVQLQDKGVSHPCRNISPYTLRNQGRSRRLGEGRNLSILARIEPEFPHYPAHRQVL